MLTDRGFTAKELASILGLPSTSTIRSWARRGHITPIARHGKVVLYDGPAVRAFVLTRRATPR